mmetsp:Transcript_36738/g.118083  ORF Transcript_36738/g.118083 Transcript_36738/m.118083 type:complete len:188 (+) Transcript_36738:439-1002(+)
MGRRADLWRVFLLGGSIESLENFSPPLDIHALELEAPSPARPPTIDTTARAPAEEEAAQSSDRRSQQRRQLVRRVGCRVVPTTASRPTGRLQSRLLLPRNPRCSLLRWPRRRAGGCIRCGGSSAYRSRASSNQSSPAHRRARATPSIVLKEPVLFQDMSQAHGGPEANRDHRCAVRLDERRREESRE